MKDLARNNLYFKGFPVDSEIPDLTQELKMFFEKFGEVKSIKLMSRNVDVNGVSQERLIGFGFVSFQNLETAQKARFDVKKELFRGSHELYVN